jgi:RNA polymerase sigma-70 factor (ECF subfamily)
MRGDDSVWGEVYGKTRRCVYFMTLKTLRSEQDAQDIAQDVYIHEIRSINQLYSANSSYGWLSRIIH